MILKFQKNYADEVYFFATVDLCIALFGFVICSAICESVGGQ
jgi:hypothetical protein